MEIPKETLDWMEKRHITKLDPKWEFMAPSGMLYSREYLATTPTVELELKYKMFTE